MAKKEPEMKLAVEAETSKSAAPSQAEPLRRKVSFDEWWMLVSHSRKLAPRMKDAIKIHFKAKGFLDNGKFDEGLRDFGL